MVAARASRGDCLPNSLVCNSSGRPRGPPVRDARSRGTLGFTPAPPPGGGGPHKNNTHVHAPDQSLPKGPTAVPATVPVLCIPPLRPALSPHPASLNPPQRRSPSGTRPRVLPPPPPRRMATTGAHMPHRLSRRPNRASYPWRGHPRRPPQRRRRRCRGCRRGRLRRGGGLPAAAAGR